MNKEIQRLLKSCKFNAQIAQDYYGGDNEYFKKDKAKLIHSFHFQYIYKCVY